MLMRHMTNPISQMLGGTMRLLENLVFNAEKRGGVEKLDERVTEDLLFSPGFLKEELGVLSGIGFNCAGCMISLHSYSRSFKL